MFKAGEYDKFGYNRRDYCRFATVQLNGINKLQSTQNMKAKNG
jgi:hypothetical protein